jgi:hypothetical protein
MIESKQDADPADDGRAQDIELYAAMLTFTMQRLQVANDLLAQPARRVDIEACALQIRIALENVVLSTMIANRPAVAAVSDAFVNKTAGDARRIVKNINPGYWPIPFRFERSTSETGEEIWRMADPVDEYLHEEDWGRAYGSCSSILHAVNPYQYLERTPAGRTLASLRVDELRTHSRKIRTLLWRHQIYLSEANLSLICRVPHDLTQRPSVEVYRREIGTR